MTQWGSDTAKTLTVASVSAVSVVVLSAVPQCISGFEFIN